MSRKRVCLGFAGVFVGLLSPAVGFGQGQDDPKSNTSERIVQKWIAEVRKPGPDPNAWEVLEGGPYDTYDEARLRSLKWSAANPTSLRDTRERQVPFRIIPPDPGSKSPRLVENSLPNVGTPVRQAGNSTPAAGKTAEGAQPGRAIRVSVFKTAEGKVQRLKGLDFDTDEYDQASKYYWLVRSNQGYSATWHDSKGRQPKVIGATKPAVDVGGTYNPPKVEQQKGTPRRGSAAGYRVKLDLDVIIDDYHFIEKPYKDFATLEEAARWLKDRGRGRGRILDKETNQVVTMPE
jgi:hypothetical protein